MATAGGSNIVKSGLVLYLDPANPKSYVSGSTVINNITGSASGGTLTGGTFSGINGNVIITNGTSDYITVTLPVFSSTYSLSFWFKPINLPGGEIQLFSSPADVASLSFFDTVAGVYRLGSWNGSSYRQTNAIIRTGSWYNFVMVNSANTTHYVNGYLDSTHASTATLNSGTATIACIGGTARFLNAHLSSVMFYNKALSAAEILQNFNATKGRFGL